MKSTIATLAVAAALAVPAVAAASALSSEQVNAITALLSSFGVDASTIAQVRADLSSTASTPPSKPPSACPVPISADLSLGAQGSDVASLQQYLVGDGYLTMPPGVAYGYFGPVTLSAVKQFQTASGITATGYVGPATRGYLCSTPTPVPPAPTSGALTAAPTSGAAPLAVSFTGGGLTGGAQYIIDYGDGFNSGALAAVDVCMHLSDGSGGCPKVNATHTYPSAGTYTATLEPYVACMWSNPRCMIATQMLGSATIVVTGGTAAAPAGHTSVTCAPGYHASSANPPTCVPN